MGTTYRVTLAADIPGLSRGEVHLAIEKVLARIDRGASTWREDSDVSRFNSAAAGEWVEVGEDLMRLVEIARGVHAETDGSFDITIRPLLQLWKNAPGALPPEQEIAAARWLVGMQLVESRAGGPAALRKTRPGVELDLGGIGPGYGVDCIGERLLDLGSAAHLVELGGEARSWGKRPDGQTWRVAVVSGGEADHRVIELAPGEAIAWSTIRPGRSPIDPRTGRPPATAARTAIARASSCAVADARAVAAAIGGAAEE